MSICGLDFGTSNTTLGTIIDDVPVLAALEGDHVTIPSAIFYRADAGSTGPTPASILAVAPLRLMLRVTPGD